MSATSRPLQQVFGLDRHWQSQEQPPKVTVNEKTSVRTIMRVEKMERHDFTSMSMDELWSLHEQVTSILAHKISTGRDRLEQRLRCRSHHGQAGDGRAATNDVH
jgi:hypothetical protein